MWPKRDDTVKLDEDAVRKIMAHRRIGLRKLARLIDQDKRALSRWISGELNPTRPNAHKIADILDCDIEHLTGEKPFAPDPVPVSTINAPISTEATGTVPPAGKGFLGQPQNQLLPGIMEKSAVKRVMTNTSFFNAADEALSPFIGQQVFEESLLLNILFQENILLHEVYFFNSGNLGAHVSSTEGFLSLFEVAALNGIVLPAFRSRDCKSLEHAYMLMREDNIYGQAWPLINPQIKPVLFRIIAAVDNGTEKTGPFYWPEQVDVGAGYQSIVQRLLQNDRPPLNLESGSDRDGFFKRHWELTQKWRLDCVNRAIQQTKQKGGTGLQRIELYRAIGHSLGVTEYKHHDPRLDLLAKCADNEERMRLEVFLKWLAQCHHLNYAKTFDVAINFPAYNLDKDFVIESLLRTPLDAPPPLTEGFRCKVRLPPIDEMLKSDPRNLIDIRSDLGKGYLLALKQWQADPELGENAEAVITTLQNYCEQITKRYQCGGVPVVASFGPRGSSQDLITPGDAVAGHIALGVPRNGVFLTVDKHVKILYEYAPARNRGRDAAPQSRDIEVTLPPE